MKNIKHKLGEEMNEAHRTLWYESSVTYLYKKPRDEANTHPSIPYYGGVLRVPMNVPNFIKNTLFLEWEN